MKTLDKILQDAFTEIADMSDYDAGGFLLGAFIALEAESQRIPPDNIPEEFAERVRRRILTLETQAAENAALEKALHKAAKGDFETAGKFIKRHIKLGSAFHAALDEAKTGRRKQRERAKRPRPDPLTTLILQIVEANPDITEKELLEELRKQEGGGVIDEITDDTIHFIKDGAGGSEAPISGLKDRLSRAKKEIRSR